MSNKAIKYFAITAILTSLSFCNVKKDSEDNNENLSVQLLSFSAVSDTNGTARSTFSVPAGTKKFQLTASSSTALIRIDSVVDSDNNEFVQPGGLPISTASDFTNGIAVASVPSRDFDPSLNDGATYQVVSTVTDGGGRGQEGETVTYVLSGRDDSNLGSGTLNVNVFIVGSVLHSETSRAIIDDAINVMRDTYSNELSTNLNVEVFNVEGPNLITDPGVGSDFYLSNASLGQSPAVNIFIALDISPGGLLGVAAAIPGPAFPSGKSAVAVSFANHAGPDGLFSNYEIRLLGETLAHESGHFLGLFHPVEISGILVVGEDPLTDTPTCSTFIDCGEQNGLYTNLMFPFPVSDGLGESFPQNELTSQQKGVVNRYIASS